MRRLVLSILCVTCLAWPGHADSLWSDEATARTGALYTRRAPEHKLGDIVTIRIVENVAATNDVKLETDKESQKEFRLKGVAGAQILQGLFGTQGNSDVNFRQESTSEFKGDAENKRSQRVTGIVSAQIVELLDTGNLRLEATQAVHVNEEMNTIILTGIVRPLDIEQDNTVLSTRIANAEIFYTGRGPATNTTRRGILTELFEFIWPF